MATQATEVAKQGLHLTFLLVLCAGGRGRLTTPRVRCQHRNTLVCMCVTKVMKRSAAHMTCVRLHAGYTGSTRQRLLSTPTTSNQTQPHLELTRGVLAWRPVGPKRRETVLQEASAARLADSQPGQRHVSVLRAALVDCTAESGGPRPASVHACCVFVVEFVCKKCEIPDVAKSEWSATHKPGSQERRKQAAQDQAFANNQQAGPLLHTLSLTLELSHSFYITLFSCHTLKVTLSIITHLRQ